MADNDRPNVEIPPAPGPAGGHADRNITGVVKIVGDSQLSRQFLAAGDTLSEAVVGSNFRDENDINDIARLYFHLLEFNEHGLMNHHLEALTMKLNARRAVSFMASKLALQAGAGIIAPELMGAYKKGWEQYQKYQKQKATPTTEEQDEQHPA